MFTLGSLAESLAHSDQRPDRGGNTIPLAQTLRQSTQVTKPQTGTNQAKTSAARDQKKDLPGQKPKAEAGPEPNDKRSVSPEEKRQQALSLVEEALAVAKGSNPIEFKVLAQVEGAALLWPSDQARARSILQEAVNATRQFVEEEKKTRVYKATQSRTYQDRQARSGRLWFTVLRKIAAISLTLLQELTTDEAKAGKAKEAINENWTEEARAIISLAFDQIEQDPALAARLAEQSLAYGMVNWVSFLGMLSRHDAGEAERLGKVVIDRLRDGSIYPTTLSDLSPFFLAPARPATLREYFLQALLIRLRRELRPDIDRRILENSLFVAQNMIRPAARYSPRLQPEFERLASDIQQLFKSLALPLPAPVPRHTIDMPQTTATPGDTNEIRDALTSADKIVDVEARDQRYKKLATDAALKADVKLAEDMLWRMSNEGVRRATTLEVYSPLAMKALGEAKWEEAQELALKVLDPLGRTLMLDQLGQRMLQAKQEKSLVLEVYRAAASRLERDAPTINVARAWLLLLRSLFMFDPESGIDPASSAITPLNKLASTGELFTESEFSQSLSNWVTFTPYYINAGEVLYLPGMLSKAFGEMARQNEDRALTLAAELTSALRPLAQLAISREMLEKAKSADKSLPKNAK
jgi:hypothetical protein